MVFVRCDQEMLLAIFDSVDPSRMDDAPNHMIAEPARLLAK
jgi:hypothetical protein